jgi:hypothetical protein
MLLRMSKDYDVADSNLHRTKTRVLAPYFFYEFGLELTGLSRHDW